MRLLALLVCLCACVQRFATTRVTLFDRSELQVEGAGKLPEVPPGPGLVENDVVLAGRSSDVLAFDGDKLRMHLIEQVRYCHRGRPCDPTLDLRIDTPLANVRSIRDVGLANHQVIPLGLLTGTILTVLGGGMLAYEHVEHAELGGSSTPYVLVLGGGLAILAIEIRARLASDTVTVVR